MTSEFTKDVESFAEAHQAASVRVPISRATPEALADYGRLVDDFDVETVERVKWPKATGWRPVAAGNKQIIAEGDFRLRWEDDVIYADNETMGDTGIGFITGRLSRDHRHVLIRDANYHPDGGQVFFPWSQEIPRPFIMLMAPSSVADDVTPEDFRAFWFDGRCGFQIAPGVWHQAPYFPHAPPAATAAAMATDSTAVAATACTPTTMAFHNKQSSVYACVVVDTVKEFGVFLEVPLQPDN